MKWLSIPVLGATLALAATNAGLKEVHSVYLLPMAGGLDQLLAVQLTQSSLFNVVTDPSKADAVFTERIGGGFEETFKDLYEPKTSKDGKSDDGGYVHPPSRVSTRARGSIFLVDRKSRAVIWSIYEKPVSAGNQHQLAERIRSRLEKDLKK